MPIKEKSDKFKRLPTKGNLMFWKQPWGRTSELLCFVLTMYNILRATSSTPSFVHVQTWEK